MRSSNPVLTRLTPEGHVNSDRQRVGYTPGSYAQGQTTYSSPVETAATDRMTIDDVVVRTVGLLALTGLAGAAAWVAFSTGYLPEGLLLPFWIGSAMIGLVLGLIISFARVTNPLLIGAYAVVEGVFVGMVTMFFESQYEGIGLQAAAGTFGIFFVMAMLYRARVLRATPRFTKIVVGAVIGIVVLLGLNFLLSIFGIHMGIRDGGPLSIVVSLVIIVVASLTFVLDFAQIEEGVRQGMPKRYAWSCAFGILVGLIWLYLEILRLIGYLRGSD